MPRWRSWQEWWCNKEDWQRLGSVPKDQLGAQKIRDCSEKQHTHHHHHPPSYINIISCLVTHDHTSLTTIVETLSSSLELTCWTIFIQDFQYEKQHSSSPLPSFLGVSSATYLFGKMIFFENHLETFPDC